MPRADYPAPQNGAKNGLFWRRRGSTRLLHRRLLTIAVLALTGQLATPAAADPISTPWLPPEIRISGSRQGPNSWTGITIRFASEQFGIVDLGTMAFFAQARDASGLWNAEAEGLRLDFIRRGPLGGLNLAVERLAVAKADFRSLGAYITLLQQRLDRNEPTDAPIEPPPLRPLQLTELRASHLAMSAPNRSGIAWTLQLPPSGRSEPTQFLAAERAAATFALPATVLSVQAAQVNPGALAFTGHGLLASYAGLADALVNAAIKIVPTGETEGGLTQALSAAITFTNDGSPLLHAAMAAEGEGLSAASLASLIMLPLANIHLDPHLRSATVTLDDKGTIAEYLQHAGRRFHQTIDAIDRRAAVNLLPYGFTLDQGSMIGEAFEAWIKQSGRLQFTLETATPLSLLAIREKANQNYQDKRETMRSVDVQVRHEAIPQPTNTQD